MSDDTYPLTLFLQRDRELGSALLLLDNALLYLRGFAETRPERMDKAISDALVHANTAHALLDSSFYADRNADPNAPEDE